MDGAARAGLRKQPRRAKERAALELNAREEAKFEDAHPAAP